LSLLVDAQIDRQPNYHGAAMGTEAVRFLSCGWRAGSTPASLRLVQRRGVDLLSRGELGDELLARPLQC
jgi:hypothetical protein